MIRERVDLEGVAQEVLNAVWSDESKRGHLKTGKEGKSKRTVLSVFRVVGLDQYINNNNSAS